MIGGMDCDLEAVRRINSRGGCAPHLCIRFDSHLFSIDTSRAPKASVQPDAYLITHAHSDHYGKSAMLSANAVASIETARALEIRYEREYKGRTFAVGESIMVGDVKVDTHPTGHTIGSSAFSWQTETGERVLVTGDVKDYHHLPHCDYLVTEANYGDPYDPSCIFEDDLAGFYEAMESGASFGAYAFGKAQRAVALMRTMGYKDEIGMDEKSLVSDPGADEGSGRAADRGQWKRIQCGHALEPGSGAGKKQVLPDRAKGHVLPHHSAQRPPGLSRPDEDDRAHLASGDPGLPSSRREGEPAGTPSAAVRHGDDITGSY